MNKYYRYSIEARVKALLAFFMAGIILLVLGGIPALKYIIWILIIVIGFFMFLYVMYIFRTTFKVDDIGFTTISGESEGKRIPWEEFEKIDVIKSRGKIVRITIYSSFLQESLVSDNKVKKFLLKKGKPVNTVKNNLKNHKEFFETILTNVKRKNDKIIIVEKTEDLFQRKNK